MKHTLRIRVRRVYDNAEQSDGVRVLVDRLWPRGVGKDKARLDTWMKALAPSATLRRWLHVNPTTRWHEFAKRYRVELASQRAALEDLRRLGRGKRLTLVTAVADVEHSHVPVLLRALEMCNSGDKMDLDFPRVKKTPLWWTTSALIFTALLPVATAEIIKLKNGNVIEGRIVQQNDTTMTVEIDELGQFSFQRAEVASIDATPYKPRHAQSIEESNAQATPRRKRNTGTSWPERGLTETSEYLLYVPAMADVFARRPLVMALSPVGDAAAMAQTWQQVADRHQWVIMASKEFHNGLVADQFLPQLLKRLAHLITKYPVDPSKIVVTGFSGGGMGSHMFAVSHPRRVRAVVVNTGMINESCKQKDYPKGKVVVFLASPTDFRYAQMKADFEFLRQQRGRTKWIEFEGGHVLAPA